MATDKELNMLRNRLEERFAHELTVDINFNKRQVICSPAISAPDRKGLIEDVVEVLENSDLNASVRNGSIPDSNDEPVNKDLVIVGSTV